MANVTPASGTVTTVEPLNLRTGGASTSAPIVGQIQTGSIFVVTGTTQGQSISGNSTWYQGPGNVYFWSGACGALQVTQPPQAPVSPASAPAGTLPGTVQAAPPGTLGFDCDFTLTAQDVSTYVSDGYKYCIRYITRSQPTEQPGDLTTSEALTILSGGLSLMAVQHVAASPWVPTPQLGTQYGQNAVSCSREVGLPPGMNIWLDLEGVATGTPSQDIIDYCNNWFAQLAGAGYVPGLYVGANCGLNGDELYWDLVCQHYWRSGSSVPDVAVRGYQMFQRITGGDIDQDATRTDNLGGTVLWLTD
ncbi:MAG TPA: glycoside hydrolase domain-containing protein [Rhizomicrobium sp.]|nr:glycoside hydrolase domain-containing protein [Rhizomicrobium sp.]